MNALPLHRVFLALLGALSLALAARATDVTGIYDDKGVVLSSSTAGQVDAEVSLHALLSLEFDPAAGLALFGQTERVDLTQAADEIVIRCHRPEGRVSWRTEYLWEAEKGSIHGPRVIVNTRKEGQKTVYTMMFEQLENPDHLLISVFRVNPTIMGPQGEPLGTYLFTKIAAPK